MSLLEDKDLRSKLVGSTHAPILMESTLTGTLSKVICETEKAAVFQSVVNRVKQSSQVQFSDAGTDQDYSS